MTSVAVNPAWSGLIASCSGQRNYFREHSQDHCEPHRIDNSLKLWKYEGFDREIPVGSEDLSISFDVAANTVSETDNIGGTGVEGITS